MAAFAERSVSIEQNSAPADKLHWLHARLVSLKARIGRLLSRSEELVWDPETETLKPRAPLGSDSLVMMHPAVISTKLFQK